MRPAAAAIPDLVARYRRSRGRPKVEHPKTLVSLGREGAFDKKGEQSASRRLSQLADGWHEIEPGENVREAAKRFLRVHPLRAAGAWQLAAVFVAAEGRPSSLELVTLDERLTDAASKEGFVLVEA